MSFLRKIRDRVAADNLRRADGRHRKLHVDPCAQWGSQARYGDETREEPILAQVAGMRIDDALIAQVVAALSSADRPVTLDRARIERQMRTLALDHADGRIGTDAYLERHAQLRADLEPADTKRPNELTAARAVEWLRALADTWTTADVREAKAELLHAIYDRIVVVGRTIVSARLTAAAYAHGLAIALPEVVMARPEGFEPPTV